MSLGFTRQTALDEARYERLKESIDDYLGDEGGKAETLINDIRRACRELKEYHQGRLEAYNAVEGEDAFS